MSINSFSEERTEMMVVTPTNQMLQIARFLNPTISKNASLPNRPSEPPSIISSCPILHQKVQFHGCVKPQQSWRNWINSMKSAHASTWKRAGVYDAIMNSLVNIHQNRSLILWFAEKWYPKTNTFILPWGEITITLEDMMVLGGFSVLGSSVTSHVENPQDHHALYKLNKVYTKLVRSPSKKASFNGWTTKFMARQKVHEHEAFLAFWLSKYIFPSVRNTIQPETFELAIHLARGRRIALAPAVLATMYRDLHYLQNAIMQLHDKNIERMILEVFAPLYYIQVWVWERFPCVRPNGIRNTRDDETRLARWAELDSSTNCGSLDSGTGKEQFVWRPYLFSTNHFLAHTIYNEFPLCRRVSEGRHDEEVESFVRCVRMCKLVGFDIAQQYFPHRVSKQFGYDQDIPADVFPLESNDQDAWDDYATNLSNETVYLPSRQNEGHVTARYEEWWESGPVSPLGPHVPLPPKRARRRRVRAN